MTGDFFVSFFFVTSCCASVGVCGAFRWSHGGCGQRPGWQEQCCLQVLTVWRSVDNQGSGYWRHDDDDDDFFSEWTIKEKWSASSSPSGTRSWLSRGLWSLWWVGLHRGGTNASCLEVTDQSEHRTNRWKWKSFSKHGYLITTFWYLYNYRCRLQDFINFIPDYPHTEFSQECKVSLYFESLSSSFHLAAYFQTEIFQDVQIKSGLCFSDEERQRSGILLDQLEWDRLCDRSRHWVLPGDLGTSCRAEINMSLSLRWRNEISGLTDACKRHCCCSGVSRQAQCEAAEESEHQRQLVPVLSRDGCHPAVHHRAGQRPAALHLQGPPPPSVGIKAISSSVGIKPVIDCES